MPIYFLFGLKKATWRPYLFLDPHDNTVLAYILNIVQDRVLVTDLPLFTYSPQSYYWWWIGSHICGFIWPHCLWPWKVNPGHTGFQWPISPNLFKITTELLLMIDRKSYEAEMPLFLYLKEFLYFQHLPKLKKTHHRSIHNIRLQMIIDNHVFEFSNTCTVRASMVVVSNSSITYDPSPQPTAGKRLCARVPTGHCLRTNGAIEPQAELHSVH